MEKPRYRESTPIAETDERYQDQLSVYKKLYRYDDHVYIFGQDTLETIHNYARYRDLAGVSKPEMKEMVHDELEASRQVLHEMYKDPQTKLHVRKFFMSSLNDTMNKRLYAQSSLKMKARDPLSVEDLFNDERIDDLTYQELLRNNAQRIRSENIRLKRELPLLRNNFKANLSEAMTRGDIPMLKRDLITRRINQTNVVVVDPLQVKIQIDDISRVAALFNRGTSTVMFVSPLGEPISEENYTHEMIHVLSGRSVQLETYNDPVDLYNDQESGYFSPIILGSTEKIRHERIGLHTNGETDWMNEAITQILSLKVTKNTESRTYEKPRELLELLRTRGSFTIPLKVFVDAYFENDDPSTEPVAANRLSQAISEAYGDSFLKKLNKMVKNGGFHFPITVLETGDKSFIDYIFLNKRKSKKR